MSCNPAWFYVPFFNYPSFKLVHSFPFFPFLPAYAYTAAERYYFSRAHDSMKRAKLAAQGLQKHFIYDVNDVPRLARSPIITFFYKCDIDDDSTKFLFANSRIIPFATMERILRIKKRVLTCNSIVQNFYDWIYEAASNRIDDRCWTIDALLSRNRRVSITRLPSLGIRSRFVPFWERRIK